MSAILTHTCIVADDGRVWCWGRNWRSELGDGTTEDRLRPVLVSGLPDVATDVSAGYGHTCALLGDGQAYCWGDNLGGQTAPDIAELVVQRPRAVDVPEALASIHAGQGHTCGITREATVYCWGNTAAGQCGVDPSESSLVTPSRIPDLDHVTSLVTVKNHTCAARSREPSMMCWGSNQYLERKGAPVVGKIGETEEKFSARPVPVALASVTSVGMGFESTYAVTSDGRVWGWGLNSSGQVGDGNVRREENEYVLQPVEVLRAAGQPLTGVIEVLRSDGSDQCALVREEDGASAYYCWGKDDHGELGFDEEYADIYPLARRTRVIPEGATSLVRGEDHACFAAPHEGRTAIWCYGKPAWVANDANVTKERQREALPVQWDPENFAVELAGGRD